MGNLNSVLLLVRYSYQKYLPNMIFMRNSKKKYAECPTSQCSSYLIKLYLVAVMFPEIKMWFLRLGATGS